MRGTGCRFTCTLLLACMVFGETSAAQDPGPAAPQLAGQTTVTWPAPPSPRPALKRPEKGVFPFAAWSYAQAYTFNFFEIRPAPLRIVESDGSWSPHIHSQALINDEGALKAAQLVAATRGTVELTKCTFPRHAIVYFDTEDKPVASLNVCFDCEAVLANPDYPKPANFNHARVSAKFEKTLPLWRRLFERDLALPIDWRTAAKAAQQSQSAESGRARTVKASSIWFRDVAMLKSWQSLKASGNEPAMAKFEETALAERSAWRFLTGLPVTILSAEAATNVVQVEMTEEGRLHGTRWYIDAQSLEP